MTPTETAAILRAFNEWRRSDEDIPQFDLYKIDGAIDAAVEMIERLEDAESDALEQARLNGMGSEREAALMAKLEAAEKENNYARLAAEAEAEQVDRLCAKIEAMERQEPVAFGLYSGWALKATYLKEHEACEQRDRRQLTADLGGSLEAYRVSPLYALPGAQPAPSVPEDVMRDAERYRYLRGRDDSTAGVGCWLEAGGKACARGWLNGDQLDRAIDCAIEALKP